MKFRWLWIMVLCLFSVQTALAQMDLQPGDRVIIVADSLPLYTSSTATETNTHELLRGEVAQIGITDQDRGYLIGNHGWIDLTLNGQPTIIRFDATTLHQMGEDAQAAIRADSENVSGYLTAATVASSEKRNYDAIQILSQGINAVPQNRDLVYQRGALYLATNQLSEALSDFDAVQAAGYESANLYNRRSIAFDNSHMINEAISAINQAIDLAPEWGVLYNNLAAYYREERLFDYAFERYQMAIDHDPLLAYAYRNRASMYEALQQWDNAAADYNTAVSIQPFEAASYIQRANFRSKNHIDDDQALADYNMAIQVDPLSDLPYSSRGAYYAIHGNLIEAKADLEQAVALNSYNADAYFNLAFVDASFTDLKSAFNDYSRVITLGGPKAYSARLYRPQIYLLWGEYDAALDDLHQYLGTDLSSYFSAVAMIQLAAAYAGTGEYDFATSYLTSALYYNEDFTRNYYFYGAGYRITDSQLLGLDQLQQTAEANPSDADVQLHLGTLALQSGLWDIAHDSFARYSQSGLKNALGFEQFLDALKELAT